MTRETFTIAAVAFLCIAAASSPPVTEVCVPVEGLHRYKPLSVPTLQTCASAAAPAVPDVPTAITATRQTNAQVKAKSLKREALKPGGARAEVCVRLLNAESSSSQPEALDHWRRW
jgi:hypothetical protein